MQPVLLISILDRTIGSFWDWFVKYAVYFATDICPFGKVMYLFKKLGFYATLFFTWHDQVITDLPSH